MQITVALLQLGNSSIQFGRLHKQTEVVGLQILCVPECTSPLPPVYETGLTECFVSRLLGLLTKRAENTPKIIMILLPVIVAIAALWVAEKYAV